MLIILSELAFAAPASDLVTGLTLPYSLPFYSGYLEVSKAKSFHYVFFPSQATPAKDPLVLWLNGGPGCSSLDGMLYQNGPFIFAQPMNDTLTANPNSWNKKANLLYLQSPGSVGFSKGPVQSDDMSTSQDNLDALLSFFTKFPQYKNNDFYITGQSYAGVYVPFLAWRIDNHNNQRFVKEKIALKGWMVGNACTHPTECYHPHSQGRSFHTYTFLYKHGYFSQFQYQNFTKICTSNYQSNQCRAARMLLFNKFRATNTSIYNLYTPCYFDPDRLLSTSRDGALRSLSCESEGAAIRLLNDGKVKAAMHVDSSVKWDICNDEVNGNYTKYPEQSYWIYKKLISEYRVVMPLSVGLFWRC